MLAKKNYKEVFYVELMLEQARVTSLGQLSVVEFSAL